MMELVKRHAQNGVGWGGGGGSLRYAANSYFTECGQCKNPIKCSFSQSILPYISYLNSINTKLGPLLIIVYDLRNEKIILGTGQIINYLCNNCFPDYTHMARAFSLEEKKNSVFISFFCKKVYSSLALHSCNYSLSISEPL